MNRRRFVLQGAAALAFLKAHADPPPSSAPTFRTANTAWQQAYDQALAILAGNVRVLPHFPDPVLIEGASYNGIWQECGPQEALVYRRFRPDVARNSHLVFFALQHEDGQLPANNKVSETGFGQIQMVVPIAATAWELAQATHDDELLHTAYESCSRWDAWLLRYRNTRATGLIEGFCTYDTGHDNSPRWKGIPPQCPGKDARRCPPVPSLPRLCPDLSATVYGGRIALASMARALGKTSDADRWTESAATLHKLILQRLYVPEDAAFYDLDNQNQFVKIRTDVLSRVCGEHIPDQALFDSLWSRQLHNPHAFWPAYALPSVALDDPQFVRPIPRNSWGGASQALTALRAGRWMEHYGRAAEFSSMMTSWCEALIRDSTFRQQMDPLTGDFTQADLPGYSPACLVLVDYTWRLCGIRETPSTLEWNVRPGHPAGQSARFELRTDTGKQASLSYTPNQAKLTLNGKQVAQIRGIARLLTTLDGNPQAVQGIAETPQTISLTLPNAHPKRLTLTPNQTLSLSS